MALLHAAPGLGLGRVECSPPYWQPCDAGRPAVIAPVWINPPVTLPEGGRTAGVLDDLAAIDLQTGAVSLRLGYAWALGQHLADGDEPETRLRCFLDPWTWLRAGGDGVVPLDWSEFASRLSGEPRRALLIDDLTEVKRCEEAMQATLPRLPAVLVKAEGRAAA